MTRCERTADQPVDLRAGTNNDSTVPNALESSAPTKLADAEGSLREAPLVYALVHALDQGLSGEMQFRSPGGQTHTLTFFEGAPIRVRSTAAPASWTRIGEDLLAGNAVRPERLGEVLAQGEPPGQRLGERLVRAGAVSEGALAEALGEQTTSRVASLANLPPDSTFALHVSTPAAAAEPFAPWVPLDALLATVRAWEDRARVHGTVRWLTHERLQLRERGPIESLRLTADERRAVGLMANGAPTLRALYEGVGRGLSSLLYTLAVTRQFAGMSEKGPPLGVVRPSPTHASSPLPDAGLPDAGSSARVRSAPVAPRAAPDVEEDEPRAATSETRSYELRLAEEAAKVNQYETADRILRERVRREDTSDPEYQALAAWVKANLNAAQLNGALRDLTLMLLANPECESGLYYRGLLLRRAGKDRAALRDFVVLAKKNASHMGALQEIKALRDARRKV